MATPTWSDAMDNIRLAEIRLKNNVPFTMTGMYYGIANTHFEHTPDIILEVDCTGGPNEAYCEFKDGSKFGIEFQAKDSQIRYRHFIYFPEYEVTGTTNAGTPFTWSDIGALPTYFDYYYGPLQTNIPMYVDHIATSFAMFLNRDGTIDMDSYTLKYVDYAIQAHNDDFISFWREEFRYNLPDETTTYGTFGYLESQSHIVDWLCGEHSTPTEYPGNDNNYEGGGGTFYSRNYEIDFPEDPDIQAIDFGFNTIYVVNESTMQQIAQWLWSDDFDENIHLNYVDPFNNILGIALVPDNDIETTSAIMRIGNVDSNIACEKVTNEYVNVDCGELTINEHWGNFLDYNATYTIYLPFIGFRSLKTDDVVNCTLRLKYKIDLLTGACVAFLRSYNNTKDGNNEVKHILYTFNGNVFYSVAFSGANYMSQYNQQMSAVTSGISNAVQSLGKGIGAAANGDVLGMIGAITGAFTGSLGSQMAYDSAKPDYGRGGSNGGNMGFLSYRIPYIIESLPIEATPKHYLNYNGAPAQVYDHLENLHGYTEVDRIELDNLNISTAEKNELEQLLKAGVYLP